MAKEQRQRDIEMLEYFAASFKADYLPLVRERFIKGKSARETGQALGKTERGVYDQMAHWKSRVKASPNREALMAALERLDDATYLEPEFDPDPTFVG